jgi:hypothetical protein
METAGGLYVDDPGRRQTFGVVDILRDGGNVTNRFTPIGELTSDVALRKLHAAGRVLTVRVAAMGYRASSSADRAVFDQVATRFRGGPAMTTLRSWGPWRRRVGWSRFPPPAAGWAGRDGITRRSRRKTTRSGHQVGVFQTHSRRHVINCVEPSVGSPRIDRSTPCRRRSTPLCRCAFPGR